MRRYNNSEKGRANVKRWRADPDNRLSESNRNTRRVRRNRIREREAMIRGEVE
jgi:DNA-binding PadR family transcriptional regulator